MNIKNKFIRLSIQALTFAIYIVPISACKSEAIIDSNQKSIMSIEIEMDSVQTGISIDNLNQVDSDGQKISGNGSGDLVLVVYDPSGRSPRKQSLMIDLSISENKTALNDLTVNDILEINKTINIPNQDLSNFIKNSKNPKELQWGVYAIANHFNSAKLLVIPDLINFGLVISTQSRPKTTLTFQEIHLAKAIRSNLISENNRYGIESNGSLVSFTGEPSAFNPELYSRIGKTDITMASINEKMTLSIHRVTKNASLNKVQTSFQILGTVKLKFISKNEQWQFIFSPK